MELSEAVERMKRHWAWSADPESCSGLDDTEHEALRTLIEAAERTAPPVDGLPRRWTAHVFGEGDVHFDFNNGQRNFMVSMHSDEAKALAAQINAGAEQQDAAAKERERCLDACVNTLAGLSEQQIKSIDWGKVPWLIDSVNDLIAEYSGDANVGDVEPQIVEVCKARAAVERK